MPLRKRLFKENDCTQQPMDSLICLVRVARMARGHLAFQTGPAWFRDRFTLWSYSCHTGFTYSGTAHFLATLVASQVR